MVAYGKKNQYCYTFDCFRNTHIYIYNAAMSYVFHNQCNYVQSGIFVVVILWICYLVIVTVSLVVGLPINYKYWCNGLQFETNVS